MDRKSYYPSSHSSNPPQTHMQSKRRPQDYQNYRQTEMGYQQEEINHSPDFRPKGNLYQDTNIPGRNTQVQSRRMKNPEYDASVPGRSSHIINSRPQYEEMVDIEPERIIRRSEIDRKNNPMFNSFQNYTREMLDPEVSVNQSYYQPSNIPQCEISVGQEMYENSTLNQSMGLIKMSSQISKKSSIQEYEHNPKYSENGHRVYQNNALRSPEVSVEQFVEYQGAHHGHSQTQNYHPQVERVGHNFPPKKIVREQRQPPMELQESREEEHHQPEKEQSKRPDIINKVVIKPSEREEEKVAITKIENVDDQVLVGAQDENLGAIETPQKDKVHSNDNNEEETNENFKTVPRNTHQMHTNAADEIPITAKVCSFEELLARNLQNEDENEEGIFGKSVSKPATKSKPKLKPKQKSARDDSVKTQKRSDAMKNTPLKQTSKDIGEMSSTLKISKEFLSPDDRRNTEEVEKMTSQQQKEPVKTFKMYLADEGFTDSDESEEENVIETHFNKLDPDLKLEVSKLMAKIKLSRKSKRQKKDEIHDKISDIKEQIVVQSQYKADVLNQIEKMVADFKIERQEKMNKLKQTDKELNNLRELAHLKEKKALFEQTLKTLKDDNKKLKELKLKQKRLKDQQRQEEEQRKIRIREEKKQKLLEDKQKQQELQEKSKQKTFKIRRTKEERRALGKNKYGGIKNYNMGSDKDNEEFRVKSYKSEKSRSSEQEQDEDQEEEDTSDEYCLYLPPEYHNDKEWNDDIKKQLRSKDGKIQTIYTSGKIEVIFPHNKVTKQIFPDGYTIVYFLNKDVKQKFPDGKQVYYFAEVETTQTTFPDGLQVFRFNNGQIEKHFKDGTKEINFQDGSKKIITEEKEISYMPDGSIHTLTQDGIQTIESPNGEKEVTYPDGRTELYSPDGTIESL
ncbi:unnamed protein product [Moneuplotes crassus]|uniref:Centromere protein J C-terminal domain-containing protein n=1 Tax=Euplotes crassus TaxID=5936 RepID=A0AAD1XX66_EUPCR|nr:unnamed protein product [Moneuplotes crassus]